MPGYWRDEEATCKALVRLEGWADLFYRTGDRVRRPVNGGPLRFIGRLDQQVKVQGYRVELGEVESALREIGGVEAAAAIAWPMNHGGSQAIAAFVTGRELEAADIRQILRSKLQEYAVPQSIHVLPALPLNANGKIDRPALASLLAE